MSLDWHQVTRRLREIVDEQERLEPSARRLNARQCASLRWASVRLREGGFVLADEVGLGKTRVACAVAQAVLDSGGRAAAIVPRGLIPQWTREWKTLAADEDADRLKSITTFNNFVTELARDDRRRRGQKTDLQSLEQRIERACPAPKKPELWLISHGLSTPQIRFRDKHFRRAPWSIALPALVRSRIGEHAANQDGRTNAGRLNRVENSLGDTMTADAWRIVLEMADQAAGSVRRDRKLVECLQSMAWFDPRYEKDNSDYAVQFQKGGIGVDVFRKVLAHWLGAFDLVIIDEAHKSRGDEIGSDDEEVAEKKIETDLSRLLASTIRMTSDARRIGLTATPLELGAHQWQDLLMRALRGPTDFDPEPDANRISAAAAKFDHATSAARRFLADTTRDFPDPMVDDVCISSREMTKALSSVMTRRRRSREAMYEDFRATLRGRGHDRSEWSRPHRRISPIQIQTHHQRSSDEKNSYAEAWTQAFFAMECLGAALGEFKQLAEAEDKTTAALSRQFKVAYTRLAAGHLGERYEEGLSKFKEEAERSATDATPAGRRAKRIAYWVGQEMIALDRIAGTNDKVDPLTEHPRIQAAVEEIERFTSPQDTSREPEKVLIFGTFLAPMRVLAKVLEVRHALRMLAQGRPVPVALGKVIQPALVHRQALRMHDELTRYDPNWKGNKQAIDDAWHQAKNRYTALREVAKSRIEHNAQAFLFAKLGRDLEHRHFARTLDQLIQLARDFFLDTLLYSSDQKWSLTTDLDDERVQASLEQFWQEAIEPSLEQARETDDEQDLLGHVAAILDTLSADDVGQDTHHVRVLHGATKYTTRQAIQARFNRSHAAPHVLVAQSRVGREGLDFHRACRVVVQFNAEWNPGVLEQQIGRVDRIDSQWERLAKAWLSTDPNEQAEPPFIEVRRLVLHGTYDAFQWDSVHAREHLFDATLYGELLPAGALANQQPHIRQKLADAAPDFEPSLK